MPQTHRRLSREELYQLVWSEPMTAIAKRLRVSDVGLAKACRRAVVPVPERGYWAKRKAGKTTTQQPLPPRGLGMSDSTNVCVELPPEPGSPETGFEPIPPPPTFAEDMAAVAARVRDMVGKVTAPKTLTKIHPLIRQLLEDDERRREEQRARPYLASWNQPRYESPVERRRLRILNSLFLALARFGMKPSVNERDNARECGVQVGTQHVSFTLELIPTRSRGQIEANKRKAAPARLRLRIGSCERGSDSWKSWEDTEDHNIEVQATEIVVNLIVAGEAQYRSRLEQHYQWQLEVRRLEEEEERKRKEQEARAAQERLVREQKERVDRLLGEAAALRQAADIRSYVEAVLAVYAAKPEAAMQQRLQDWAAWALAEADQVDPIRSGRFLTAVNSAHTV